MKSETGERLRYIEYGEVIILLHGEFSFNHPEDNVRCLLVLLKNVRKEMNFRIDRIDISNYPLFDDMVFWRQNGYERDPAKLPVSEQMQKELANPNLYVYAVMVEQRYVGWISLVYIPKIGSRWNGHGHVYVDELWVEPSFRGRGFAKALMAKADELKLQLEATGIRLYVNINNPIAQKLYEQCGYHEDGQAHFMEK